MTVSTVVSCAKFCDGRISYWCQCNQWSENSNFHFENLIYSNGTDQRTKFEALYIMKSKWKFLFFRNCIWWRYIRSATQNVTNPPLQLIILELLAVLRYFIILYDSVKTINHCIINNYIHGYYVPWSNLVQFYSRHLSDWSQPFETQSCILRKRGNRNKMLKWKSETKT